MAPVSVLPVRAAGSQPDTVTHGQHLLVIRKTSAHAAGPAREGVRNLPGITARQRDAWTALPYRFVRWNGGAVLADRGLHPPRGFVPLAVHINKG